MAQLLMLATAARDLERLLSLLLHSCTDWLPLAEAPQTSKYSAPMDSFSWIGRSPKSHPG